MALTRQIHLDFHCSEFIEGIGNQFDIKSFQSALKKAKVNSINLFAKCHHSWSYYPTKVGKVHPHLNFDLLGQQIKAAQEIGLKTFIYFTVGWSANDASNHPEWCARNKDGSLIFNSPIKEDELGYEQFPYYHWKFMCINNGYHSLIYDQIKEICKLYSVDGFWFDIYQTYRLCYCKNCIEFMESKNIDSHDKPLVEEFYAQRVKKHCKELRKLIHEKMPNAEVFFNGTTALDDGTNFRQIMYNNNTIQDLEDLPTTWGGYDKLPMQAKFFLNAGYSITAMSGKFHTDWGEFGGFKHPDALKYEAASMIAFGAGCNFGDQLHPNGLLDKSTYESIGYAYDYVREIEIYGKGGMPFSRLGIWRSFDQESDEGVCKMLLEKHEDFDVANFKENLNDYDLIIFPSRSNLSKAEICKVKKFIKNGGSVISLSKSILNFLEGELVPEFGIKFIGDSNYDCDYTLIKDILNPVFVKTPYLNYSPAIKTVADKKVEILADIYEPIFNRSFSRYCSHQKTPYKEVKAKYPAITKLGNCIFIAHELDIMYQKFGSRIHRDVFSNCLKLLFQNPFVSVNLPSAARINLLHQEKHKRYCMHLLFSTPIKRGIATVIEDLISLNEIVVEFKFPKVIESVSLIPENENLKIETRGLQNFVTIPEFNTHCILVFHYD